MTVHDLLLFQLQNSIHLTVLLLTTSAKTLELIESRNERFKMG